MKHLLVSLFVFGFVVLPAARPQSAGKTVLDGVYTEAQAKREESLRAAAAVGDAEHRQETGRLSVLDIISNANHVRNQVAQNEESFASLDRESERLQRELALELSIP